VALRAGIGGRTWTRPTVAHHRHLSFSGSRRSPIPALIIVASGSTLQRSQVGQ
jgi:hypothetical protein